MRKKDILRAYVEILHDRSGSNDILTFSVAVAIASFTHRTGRVDKSWLDCTPKGFSIDRSTWMERSGAVVTTLFCELVREVYRASR